MRILLMGPSGSGKGTLASLLSKKLSLPVFSTGDTLRCLYREGPDNLKEQLRPTIEDGALAPLDLVVACTVEELSQPSYARGVIFEGAARQRAEAEALTKVGIVPDHIFILSVDEEILKKRITGRRIHAPSGRIYHIENFPPKVENIDDITGEKLTQRQDDSAAGFKKRMVWYREKTQASIAYYHSQFPERTHVLNGENDPQSLLETVLKLL